MSWREVLSWEVDVNNDEELRVGDHVRPISKSTNNALQDSSSYKWMLKLGLDHLVVRDKFPNSRGVMVYGCWPQQNGEWFQHGDEAEGAADYYMRKDLVKVY
jgi:hypothetical protein